MEIITLVDSLAYIAGLLAMFSFIPQAIKSMQTRSTADISWLMLIATFLSIVFFELYAWILGLVPVIIMNGIFGVVVFFTMMIKYRFDNDR
jgi:MtN3 and saliva related transmembrane protein